MIKFSSLIGGIFGLFTLGWLTMVVIPFIQLDNLQPLVDEDTGEVYPVDEGGMVARGRAVYVANGCVNCHTQQIAPGYAGTEIARQWGTRQTVARDYLYDSIMLAGWNRLGPDLTNVGERRDDLLWHYRHLYSPRSVSPDSIMPPYPFLFEKQKITGEVAHDALFVLKDATIGGHNYQVVPTDDARALVGYLMSLNRTYPLPESLTEAEAPKKEKPAAADDTEGVAPADPAPSPEAAEASSRGAVESETPTSEGQP